MRPWGRYLIGAVVGILIGTGGAVWSVRAGALGSSDKIGPWTTGRDFGTAQASAYTRAVVALRGLLALPATEARYYNAAVDDAGRPLEGRCRYAINGGGLPARWWSLTLYDPAGYLVANQPGIYSVGSAGLPSSEQAHWTVVAAPDAQSGHWLPTGKAGRFELTLRSYLPDDGGQGNLTVHQLPSITREACA
ncbi:MAG: hypothetical protein JWN66_2348 [Sphingomonas bacterium]|uniref:DUF1214 domain-containing protein n=1 Tax=Sphingomonas bacterium TaxID=1895847 RepID=UPI002602F784|nr:DUF1214 domain-containing protein [Sphingomonas bacterium]MDB5705232.1 hypothetical protein [Sphingomonas bacterium]